MASLKDINNASTLATKIDLLAVTFSVVYGISHLLDSSGGGMLLSVQQSVELGLKAMIGGTIVSLMSATIAGDFRLIYYFTLIFYVLMAMFKNK